MRRKQLPAIALDACIASSGGTQALVAGNDVYRDIPGILQTHFDSQRVFLIADENTMQAAGNEVEQALAAQGIDIAGKYVFPSEPQLHSEYSHVETIKESIIRIIDSLPDVTGPLVPVSVGSGTITDLVKRSASELSLPFLCVPTAASVDGYTSFGAALMKDGHKQTLSCDAPRCIVADTGVLSRSPSWLSSSGFGDLAGKIIAGADWIIADAAAPFGANGADRIDPTAWAMVQPGLYHNLDNSLAAVHGDKDALRTLFESLAITGFAMQYLRDSRTVSGAEHLFAHVWEMDNLCINSVPVTHGHKVAMGTLACAAFLEVLFADPAGPPPPPAAYRRPSLSDRIAEIQLAFTNSPGLTSVVETGNAKYPSDDVLSQTCQGFCDTWKDIREKVLEQVIPYTELKEMLIQAQCPVLPGEINLSRISLIACARRAQMIRNRYNELDLAWDLGCFETVLARIEASDKYF